MFYIVKRGNKVQFRVQWAVISINFDCDFKPFHVDVSNTFAFEITAFPPSRPKYESLKWFFNADGLKFYEDEQYAGSYHLEYCSEGMLSPVEARFHLSPDIWEPQSTKCRIIISFECLSYKYDQRKGVVDFANAVSSRISWEHEIVWFTENRSITLWKNKQK